MSFKLRGKAEAGCKFGSQQYPGLWVVFKAGCECKHTREVLGVPCTPTFRDQGRKEETDNAMEKE